MQRRAFVRLAGASGVALVAAPAAAQTPSATPTATPELRRMGEPASLTIAGGAKLYGSLVVPDAANPPVVVIVGGSGPVDRNGNDLDAGISTDVYAYLAAGLRSRGIASLRYDKRGVGESSRAVTSEASLRLDDYVADAAGWLTQLRDGRRFSSVSLAGHSEGSLIGMLAARTVSVRGFTSLEGPGKPIGEILRDQLANALKGTPNLLSASDRIVTTLMRGEQTNDVPQELLPIFRASVQPYLISELRYDPRQEIAHAGARVAIVQGTADLQVPVENGRELAAARPGSVLTIVPNMTHSLKLLSATVSNEMTYADATLPVPGVVCDAIAATVAS